MKFVTSLLAALTLVVASTAVARTDTGPTGSPRNDPMNRGKMALDWAYTIQLMDGPSTTITQASKAWTDLGELGGAYTQMVITVDGCGTVGGATTCTIYIDAQNGPTSGASGSIWTGSGPSKPAVVASQVHGDFPLQLAHTGGATPKIHGDGIYTSVGMVPRFIRARLFDPVRDRASLDTPVVNVRIGKSN